MSLNIESKLSSTLSRFEIVDFENIDKANLLRRIDTKYVFDITLLPSILNGFLDDYTLVSYNGVTCQTYKTVYYDTDKYWFYTQHHNGKKNRFKIRFRTYIDSNISFLEIKHKTNRRETIKSRQKQKEIQEQLSLKQTQFIHSTLDFEPGNLTPSLSNTFNRITLVSKKLDERITIDTGIIIKDARNSSEKQIDKLCIIETKRDFQLKNSHSSKVLQSLRIMPSGFSKYCMGLAIINKSIKQNLFKSRLLNFQSILN